MILPRIVASCLSPGGRWAGLSILIFHRVLPNPDPLFPGEMEVRQFDQILSCLGSTFNVLPLEDAIVKLASGTLPPRAAAITFDDGYADNYTVALPTLRKHRMNATFFIASGFLDGGRMFNDTIIEAVRRFNNAELDLSALGLGTHLTRNFTEKRATIDQLLSDLKYLPIAERSHKVADLGEICGTRLPDDLMMTCAQLRRLSAAGMTIGGHTQSHPILTTLDDDSAYKEILAGKDDLEAILGAPIYLFAYPNGKPRKDYLASHANMVRRAGYSAAVTTSPGGARKESDMFQLPRFTPWGRTPFRFGLRMALNLKSSGEVLK